MFRNRILFFEVAAVQRVFNLPMCSFNGLRFVILMNVCLNYKHKIRWCAVFLVIRLSSTQVSGKNLRTTSENYFLSIFFDAEKGPKSTLNSVLRNFSFDTHFWNSKLIALKWKKVLYKNWSGTDQVAAGLPGRVQFYDTFNRLMMHAKD